MNEQPFRVHRLFFPEGSEVSLVDPTLAMDIFGRIVNSPLYVISASLIVSLVLALSACLPWCRGQRTRILRAALAGFLVFVLFFGTLTSLNRTMFFVSEWSPLSIAQFAWPVVVMVVGLAASIGYGVRAALRTTGRQRLHGVLWSLLWAGVFAVGVAPHTALTVLPMISAEDHANRPGTLTHIGEPVPDFELESTEGSRFDTSDLRGKVIVLNFFATWCGPCRKEMPQLQALWDEFRTHDDFRMLVVGREESDSSVRSFRDELALTLPFAADPDRLVFDRFASQSIPRTYLISRDGTIVHQFTGAYDGEIAKLKKLLKRELGKKRT